MLKYVRLRDHWSVAVLGALSVVFLVAAGSALTRDAAAAAGFAFAGATIARAVDVLQQHRKERAEADDALRRDLDETRRVVYMALIAQRTDRYEVVATAANALAHHSLRVPLDDAITHLVNVVEGRGGEESEQWLRRQIDAIDRTLRPAR
jgi:hypothetical protein